MPSSTMLKRPSSQLLDPDDVADAADVVQRRLIVVVEPVRLDHRDPPAAVDRVAHHLAIARLEDVQRQLASAGTGSPRPAGRSGRGASGSCEQQSGEPPALRARPRIFQALRFEQLEEALARRAIVPFAVAADDLEQTRRPRRRGRRPPSWRRQARTAPRDRRDWRRAALRAPPYPRRARQASSSAARARAISGFFARSSAAAEQSRVASSVSPAATSARTRPPITSGSSGAISRIWRKTLTARVGIALGQDLLAHRDQRLDLGLGRRAFALDLAAGRAAGRAPS